MLADWQTDEGGGNGYGVAEPCPPSPLSDEAAGYCVSARTVQYRKPAVEGWLHKLLGSEFFCPCPAHPATKKNEVTHFCTECTHGTVCQHCMPHHSGHQMLQIRRYVYCDVVRASDMAPHVDVSGIQTYIINQAKVMFLNPRPQSKVMRASGPDACRTCLRALREGCTFCSLYCRVQRDPMGGARVQPSAAAGTSASDSSESCALRHLPPCSVRRPLVAAPAAPMPPATSHLLHAAAVVAEAHHAAAVTQQELDLQALGSEGAQLPPARPGLSRQQLQRVQHQQQLQRRQQARRMQRRPAAQSERGRGLVSRPLLLPLSRSSPEDERTADERVAEQLGLGVPQEGMEARKCEEEAVMQPGAGHDWPGGAGGVRAPLLQLAQPAALKQQGCSGAVQAVVGEPRVKAARLSVELPPRPREDEADEAGAEPARHSSRRKQPSPRRSPLL